MAVDRAIRAEVLITSRFQSLLSAFLHPSKLLLGQVNNLNPPIVQRQIYLCSFQFRLSMPKTGLGPPLAEELISSGGGCGAISRRLMGRSLLWANSPFHLRRRASARF